MLHAFFRILVCGHPPCAPFWAFALDLMPKRDPDHLLIFYSTFSNKESKIAPKCCQHFYITFSNNQSKIAHLVLQRSNSNSLCCEYCTYVGKFCDFEEKLLLRFWSFKFSKRGFHRILVTLAFCFCFFHNHKMRPKEFQNRIDDIVPKR